MSAYILVSYDIRDAEGFEGYVPGVLPLLERHGAEILVADFDVKPIEGNKHGVYVVLRFESEDAALAWYNDSAYEPVRKIRLTSCDNNHMVLAKAFAPPTD
ncbi:MAG TPA: DUF1330 domain-containing protein [Pirellulaceae bacterium]|nr:DUF1330 domain-containing protein [Pirellulaceae bacterium]